MPRLPIKGRYPKDWGEIARRVKDAAGGRCVRCGHVHDVAAGRMLTVHHFDGDKANCEPWNLMPLCQACHLSVQARVNPAQGLMHPPAVWSMPYIAGMIAAARTPTPIGFDLDRWIGEYNATGRPWPNWAPAQELKS